MRTNMVVLYVAAALIALLYASANWRRRHSTPLAFPLAVIMAGAAAWSAAQACSLAATTPALALAFNYAIFPGVAMAVAGFFWYATISSGRPPPRIAVLLIQPMLLMAVIATDPWHHLFYRQVDAAADYGIVVFLGPAYWAHTLYSYGLLAVGTAMVVRAMRRAVRGQRRVYLWFLVGGSAPTVGNLVTLFFDLDKQRFDLTPVLFLVTGMTWWWTERSGVSSERVPIAYAQVIAALSDAVMVLDPNDRFLDSNPAAVTLLADLDPASAGAVVGRQWQDVVGPHITAIMAGTTQGTVPNASGQVYDFRVVRMRAPDGGHSGTVVVVRDVTELERLRAELTEQAIHDGLTGLYNRRHLTAVLDAQAHAATADGLPLSVVMIDVDHFKSVNDRYGHAVGDHVLSGLARDLTGAVRESDTVARYGGEEFVVVMPGVDARTAAERADRWRRRCADTAIDTPFGTLHITFSAGVAQLPTAGSADDLLRLADEAMYRAKQAGRNQILVAGSVLPVAHPAYR